MLKRTLPPVKPGTHSNIRPRNSTTAIIARKLAAPRISHRAFAHWRNPVAAILEIRDSQSRQSQPRDYSQLNVTRKLLAYHKLSSNYAAHLLEDDYANGICGGYSAMVGNAFIIQGLQIENNPLNIRLPYDLRWLWSTMDKIVSWDGKELPPVSDQQDFNEFTSMLFKYQDPVRFCNTGFGNLHADGFLKHEYSITGLFKAEDFIKPLKFPGKESASTLFDEIFRPGRIAFTRSNIHSTLIARLNEGKNLFYDSNSKHGMDLFPVKITMDRLFWNNGYDPQQVKAFSFKIFSAQEPLHYVPVTELLMAVTLHNIKEINTDNLNCAIGIAAMTGCFDSLKFYLNLGVDIEAKDPDGSTLLNIALSGGHTDIADYLIEKNADIHAEDNGGLSAVHRVARTNATHCMAKLFSRGANLNARTKKGRTPLHYAAALGKSEMTSWLLSQHVNIRAKDSLGFTPIEHAHLHNQSSTAKLLLEQYANETINDIKPTHRIK